MNSQEELKQEIIIIIKNYLEKNPNDRFCQALFNLGITEFADKNNPEAKCFAFVVDFQH